MSMSNKKRYTFTLTPRVYNKLCSLSRRNDRSKRNMVEVLINNAYENKCDLTCQIIRQKIDELER